MKLSYKLAIILYSGLFLDLVWTVFFVLPLTELVRFIPFLSSFNPTINKLITVFLLSILPATILILILMIKVIIQPLWKIKAITQIISSGNLGKIIDISSKDEIGQLAQNINQIIKNLVTAYQEMANSYLDAKEKREQLALSVEHLKEAKAQDEALLTSIGDGVVAVGNNGNIIFANKSAELLLGFRVDEMIGKAWNNFLLAFERKGEVATLIAEQPIAKVLQTGVKFQRDCFFSRKDRSTFPAAITLAPIIINNFISGAILIFRDITLEKEIDRMKTEFISLASHQLRTPLSAIRWFIELLEGSNGLNPEQKDLVYNINQATLRMIELVNSLLNISRIESGRIIIDPKPTDLSQLVKELVKELQPQIIDKEQQLIISIHEQLPKINIDPKLIREVYLNLLTNAIKYTPKKGQIVVFISHRDEQIVSQVSDSGIGIPKNELNKVFQKFFRAENVLNVETDGNGLGLYLVKAIIESSNGKIWFSSKENKGTTFWFSLPLSSMVAKKGDVTLND